MRKFILLVAVLTSLIAPAQNIVFTDANLKSAIISNGIDINTDGEISISEAAFVDSLDIDSADISSVADLSNFPFLSKLYLKSNNLTSFPSLNLPRLTFLDLSYNSLTSINVSSYSTLEELYISYNPSIASLNLNGLTKLIKVGFGHTAINVIDLSGLSELKEIWATTKLDTLKAHSGFEIVSNSLWQIGNVDVIDISNHPTQTSFVLSYQNKQIKLIKADNCPKLKLVSIINTPIEEISTINSDSLNTIIIDDYNGPKTVNQFLTINPNLKKLNLGNEYNSNQLIQDSVVIDGNDIIQELNLFFINKITVTNCNNINKIAGIAKKVTVDNCPKFTTLAFSNMEKVSINNCSTFAVFPQGHWNPMYAGTIKEVSITNCPALLDLRIQWYSSKLIALNLTGSSNITTLQLGGNALDTLDLTTNLKLEKLECQSNPIRNVDVSYLPELTYLNCNTTSMKTLDLCFENKLSHLNVSGHDSLFHVYVQDTNRVNIATIIPSDDSTTMFMNCADRVTSVISTVNNNSSKTPIRAFNLLGKQVPIQTKNEIIIIEYSDGTYKKVFAID